MMILDAYGGEHAIPGPWRTVTAIKEANKARGEYWFSPSTMRFFDSRIARGVIAGRLFVSSERPPGGQRVYMIRIADDAGSITHLAEEYPTLTAARARARELVRHDHHPASGTPVDARTGPHRATCACGQRIRATSPSHFGTDWVASSETGTEEGADRPSDVREYVEQLVAAEMES